jgi:ribonuclease G
LLKLFRRKLRKEQAPTESAAPDTVREVIAPPAAETAAQPTKRKRRRGTRGGRNRRKPASKTATAEAATATAVADPPAKPKPQRAKKTEAAERPARRRAQPRRRTPAKRPPLPPAKRELLMSVDVGEQRVAVLEDDRVAEVYLERPDRRSIAGNIYKGSVDNVLPGMEAAFVEIGLEKNGFLYVDEIVLPELEGRGKGRKIQDLLSRGQQILVQAVKDPMKGKGARMTTEISLPGRFVVFVPNGEGFGVSRRLEDDERIRLRDILKEIAPKEGGVIVRTAAEGASAEDIERDLVFLQRLWKAIKAKADETKAPALVYQESELPLRVVRDLFTEEFERALIDHERTYKRVVGYLKKTSPHMVERVERYRDKRPLFEASGVEEAIRSTLSRRVDLPSGGYLIFDYAEAFTVIDVNTGRFVGSRSKSSGARLEDTITANNLEAVKEVVHQLRLRDIGGIIVIDFIDMANPKNRETVEEALKKELERDRTKTYVVEISPLGLVEMTRQNVTEGPREILTSKCPTCHGDGIVLSVQSAAMDAERRLRTLAAGSKRGVEAFRVELEEHVAEHVIGPGAERLVDLEELAKRRFFIERKAGVGLDHFKVLGEGKLADLAPQAPLAEGQELRVELVEVGLHDVDAATAKHDGLTVSVAHAAKLVGKKLKVRIDRVLDGTAYASLVQPPAGSAYTPITAEAEAEKPTRAPARRKTAAEEKPKPAAARPKARPAAKPPVRDSGPGEGAPGEPGGSPATDEAPLTEEPAAEQKPKRKTRRGSRGGRGRKKKTPAAAAASNGGDPEAAPAPVATIHVPAPELGAEDGASADGETAATADGEQPVKKKRTRRGSRGGRNRRKKPAATKTDSSGSEAS